MNYYNYEYFSGANVKISFKNVDLSNSPDIEVIECAGLSYSVQNSQQPIYGYSSTQFDAMLPGREIVQGNFVLNYIKPDYLLTDVLKNPLNQEGSRELSFNGFLADSFDITVRFGNKNQITIKNCYLISRGQTIQISEQVLLEEYGFLGRTLSYKNIN
ncbi:hypothetical protein CMI37_34010 [Candidatus Pacearchaeota archaeon]|nr:hypothetical protein [Candidatus Pacearchaeota archaeon]